jgi:hypothetical protein
VRLVSRSTGLIYEPTVQICLFDDSWPFAAEVSPGRRLSSTPPDAGAQYAASKLCNVSEIVSKMCSEQATIMEDRLVALERSLHAAHQKELMELRAGQDEMRAGQHKMQAMLEQLLNTSNN